MGAIDPSMLQCAPIFPLSAIQRGALIVTAATGSPINEGEIALPTFAAEQSLSVIVMALAGVVACVAARTAGMFVHRTMTVALARIQERFGMFSPFWGVIGDIGRFHQNGIRSMSPDSNEAYWSEGQKSQVFVLRVHQAETPG
jgi:hypothetical protein